MTDQRKIFYGWWIVLAAFLNLFFTVGIIFYGFPVFYASFVESLGFTRAQATQGFLLGFIFVGLPFGFFAGTLIDKIGARKIILAGLALVGISLFLMKFMTRLWQYELLCILEVLGYMLAGPIANQVLIARWFRKLRGRAMGAAYLGLGFGGVFAPLLSNYLIRTFGWRSAIEFIGILTMAILVPVGIWITRSSPSELGLFPDGAAHHDDSQEASTGSLMSGAAIRTANFWYILLGSALVIGAIGAVTQHFILFLKDLGYSTADASRFSTLMLVSSLCGRIIVGFFADRFSKKNIMAFFYLVIGMSVLLLGFSHHLITILTFAVIFGFSMGADYMLIPLVTAECFGTRALGRILALIVMGYSLGQWGAPWLIGKLFDAQHSYSLGWKIMAVGGILGAFAVSRVSGSSSNSAGDARNVGAQIPGKLQAR